jgi:phosphopantetheinyl transferase (holo-ACP synthase)
VNCDFFFVGKSLLSFRRNISREKLGSECENLLRLSCEKLNLDFGEVKRNVHGKPYLEKQNFFFSFSHSKDVACCVVDEEHPVGIDVQFVSEKLLAVKSRFLHPNDFFFEEESLEKLCQIWCMKEAVFKAAPQHLVSLKNIFVKDCHWAEDKNGFGYNLFCSRFDEFHFALAINL